MAFGREFMQALFESFAPSNRYVADRIFPLGNQLSVPSPPLITIKFEKDPRGWAFKEDLEKLGYSEIQAVDGQMWGIAPGNVMPVPIKNPELILFWANQNNAEQGCSQP